MSEIWKPIPITRGLYEVSDQGNVRSYWSANGFLSHEPRPIKPAPSSNGYLGVAVGLFGDRKTHTVHRCVLAAFVGPCPKGTEVAHLDGNKANNRLDNLRYVSRSENHLHKRAHGTMYCGEKHHRSKLTAEQVKRIRQLHGDGFGSTTIGRMYGIARQHVQYIVRRKIWKSV